MFFTCIWHSRSSCVKEIYVYFRTLLLGDAFRLILTVGLKIAGMFEFLMF